MQFTELEIQNFMGMGHADLHLADKGLVLIQGENRDDTSQDSNGAGKSTILEALYWCLYGKTSRGLTGDAVVNNVTGKDCFVRVRIQDGDDEYVVERWRKMSRNGKKSGVAVYRYDDDDPVDLSKGTDKMTQEVVNGVVGCSEEVFEAAVYAAQESMPDIPKMTDRQLKGLIEEASGIELVEAAYQIARDRAREEKARVETLRANLERDKERVADQRARIENYERQRLDWDAQREDRVKAAKAKLVDAANAAKAAAVERDKVDEAAVKDAIEARLNERDKVDEKLDGLKAEGEESLRLSAEVTKARGLVDRYLGDKRRSEGVIKGYEREAQDSEERIGTPCGECGKEITADDLKAVQDAIQRKWKQEEEVLAGLEKKIETAKNHLAKCERAYDKHQAGLTDTSDLAEERRKIEKALSALRDALRMRERCQDRLDELKRTARFHSDRLKEVEAESNPFIDMINEGEAKLRDLVEAEDERRSQHVEASKSLEIANAVVEVYGPKGVRAHILDTVTPFLNDRTAHYLGTLSDGRLEAVWSTITLNAKGEARENFSLDVKKDGGGSSFAALSGGEKRKVRLSCALALQDLVASRATKPINIWLGDEIDVALDPAGLERLMSILEMKAREKGTVLVVSHQSLRDWVRDVALVTMEDGKATVSGVLEAA